MPKYKLKLTLNDGSEVVTSNEIEIPVAVKANEALSSGEALLTSITVDNVRYKTSVNTYTQLKTMTSIAANGTTTISVGNLTNYKYIIIRAYYSNQQNHTAIMLPTKFLRAFYTGSSTSGTLYNLPLTYSASAVRWCRFGFPSDTQIFIANGSAACYYGIWGYND